MQEISFVPSAKPIHHAPSFLHGDEYDYVRKGLEIIRCWVYLHITIKLFWENWSHLSHVLSPCVLKLKLFFVRTITPSLLILYLPPWQRRLCFWWCWFVCLSVCGQHYSKSYERIGMKFYGGILGSTMKNWLYFGGDLDILRWVNEQNNAIIVVAYPDCGAGNDPKLFFFFFFFFF